MEGESKSNNKLFVGGIARSTSDAALAAYFSQFGAVVSANIMRVHPYSHQSQSQSQSQSQQSAASPSPAQHGTSRGFGFVTFEDGETVQKILADAAAQNTTFELEGRKLDVKLAVPKEHQHQHHQQHSQQQQPFMTPSSLFVAPLPQDQAAAQAALRTKKIFVGGIAPSVTAEELTAYFQQFGDVSGANVIMDATSGRSRGFAFVTFENEDSTDKACEQSKHTINEKPVDVKKATPQKSYARQYDANLQAMAVSAPASSFPPSLLDQHRTQQQRQGQGQSGQTQAQAQAFFSQGYYADNYSLYVPYYTRQQYGQLQMYPYANAPFYGPPLSFYQQQQQQQQPQQRHNPRRRSRSNHPNSNSQNPSSSAASTSTDATTKSSDTKSPSAASETGPAPVLAPARQPVPGPYRDALLRSQNNNSNQTQNQSQNQSTQQSVQSPKQPAASNQKPNIPSPKQTNESSNSAVSPSTSSSPSSTSSSDDTSASVASSSATLASPSTSSASSASPSSCSAVAPTPAPASVPATSTSTPSVKRGWGVPASAVPASKPISPPASQWPVLGSSALSTKTNVNGKPTAATNSKTNPASSSAPAPAPAPKASVQPSINGVKGWKLPPGAAAKPNQTIP